MVAVTEAITTCRVCGSAHLREVLDLGSLAVSDFVDGGEPLFAPLVLTLCNPQSGGCAFVQLKHRAVDQSVLYTRYWYRSGTNEAMRAALADVVACARSAVPTQPGDIVVDIGANDGTLLRGYGPDVTRIGFEPLGGGSGRH